MLHLDHVQELDADVMSEDLVKRNRLFHLIVKVYKLLDESAVVILLETDALQVSVDKQCSAFSVAFGLITSDSFLTSEIESRKLRDSHPEDLLGSVLSDGAPYNISLGIR